MSGLNGEAFFIGLENPSVISRNVKFAPTGTKTALTKLLACQLSSHIAEVRRLTKRTRGHSPVKVIADLRAYLRGAVNYHRVKGFALRGCSRWAARLATFVPSINGYAGA